MKSPKYSNNDNRESQKYDYWDEEENYSYQRGNDY